MRITREMLACCIAAALAVSKIASLHPAWPLCSARRKPATDTGGDRFYCCLRCSSASLAAVDRLCRALLPAFYWPSSEAYAEQSSTMFTVPTSCADAKPNRDLCRLNAQSTEACATTEANSTHVT